MILTAKLFDLIFLFANIICEFLLVKLHEI